MFPTDVIAEFKLHAISEWPREAVGLILEQGEGEFIYMACDNIAELPEEDAVIPAKDFARAHTMGRVASILHSHPKGKIDPSGADMAAQLQWGIPFGVSLSSDDSCSNPFFWGAGVKPADYVGRIFINGWQDCYALLKDWMKQEMGIDLPVIPHDHYWWEKNQNLYLDNLDASGFRKLGADEPIQRGDCFLMRIRSKVPNHAGVYEGKGLIVHHIQGMYSIREPLHRHRDFIWGWFRHKDVKDA